MYDLEENQSGLYPNKKPVAVKPVQQPKPQPTEEFDENSIQEGLSQMAWAGIQQNAKNKSLIKEPGQSINHGAPVFDKETSSWIF